MTFEIHSDITNRSMTIAARAMRRVLRRKRSIVWTIFGWSVFVFNALLLIPFDGEPFALDVRTVTSLLTEVSPWKSRKEKDGAQRDMIIDSADRVINVCEMKFCEDDFSINAAYDKNLLHKLSTFAEETKCMSSWHLTLVTTYGLKFNEYAGRVQSVVTMDDLFK